MGIVFVQQVESYKDDTTIQKYIDEMLDSSLMSKKLFEGANVVIKTNLLMKKKPEDAVTTHPIILQCIANYFLTKKCNVTIADSPAGPFTKSALEGIYSYGNLNEVTQNSKVKLNYDTSYSEIKIENSYKLKSLKIINVVKEADFIINAAKLKTHGMMTYTGAVKNLFGIIPGLTKAEYHFKLVSKENFAHHLIDIERYIKPDYSIIDAIEAMEGNGPSNGIKRNLGLLIGGENAYEADYIATDIVSISSSIVPTLYLAEQRGIFNQEKIILEGFYYKNLKIEPFILPDSMDITFLPKKIPQKLKDYIMNKLKAKPYFNHTRCISCGHCVRNCPAKIITMTNDKPIFDSKKCISCFCCHEVCPVDAIKIKKSLLLKILK